MMIDFQGLLGDPPHKINARHEVLKLECADDGLRAFRPVRNGFQVEVGLFCGQGWHNSKLIIVPLRTARWRRG